MNNNLKSVQFILAALVGLGFFVILGFMLLRPVPEENQAILNVMLGALGTVFTQQMMYFFGSTSASKDKDKVISDALASAPNQPIKTVDIQAETANVTTGY